MFGQKVWFGKKDLLKFGINYCYLSKNEVEKYYAKCIKALTESIYELEQYLKINTNIEFEDIGSKMIDTWKLSLDENRYKEIPDEIIRNWNKNKRA